MLYLVAPSSLGGLLRKTILFALLMASNAPAGAAELFQTAAPALVAEQTPSIERIRNQPTTAILQAVTINLDALQDSTTSLALPDAQSIGVVEVKREIKSATDYIWYGALAGNAGRAIFVVRGGDVTGSVDSTHGSYQVLPLGNGLHVVVKINESHRPPEHSPGAQRRPGLRGPAAAAAVADNPLPRIDTGPQTIDVLVAYTARAASGAGGGTDDAAIRGKIDIALSDANRSYANSDISLELNIVHVLKVDYDDANKSLPDILGALVAKTDGAMDNIHQLRDQYHADIVVLITGEPNPQSCGQAKTTLATESEAFAVIWQTCLTNGSYSFAHEIGHLMGAQHDPASDAQDQDARFTYGHGYQQGTDWRTVMAYDCPRPVDPPNCGVCNSEGYCEPACYVPTNPICPRLLYWSNPKVLYGGTPMGTEDVHDNASVLRASATRIAGFRTRTLTWSPWENLSSPQFTLLHGPKCVSAGADTIDCFSNSTYNKVTNDAGDTLVCDGNNDDPNRIGCAYNLIFTDGVVHHRRWSGGAWSPWESLSGNFYQTPDCVTAAANRIDCIGMATGDAGVLHSWTTGDGAWKPWENLSGESTIPYCLGGTPNRVDCFISADVILHRSWNGTAWSDWQRLPSQQTLWLPDCVRWGSDQLDCFALGRDDGIMYQARKTSAGWSGWTALGEAPGAPRCFGWGATNRIECFTRGGADQAVQHRRWNGTEWSAWQSVDKLADLPTCLASGLNRIDCFGRGSDKALWHRWGAGSAWSAWENLGGEIFETPSCVSPKPNRIDCFVHGKERAMFHISGSR